MSLRTVDEYLESLRDDRNVYFRGTPVDDVTDHPAISKAVNHGTVDFRMAEDPDHRPLAVVEEDGEAPYSRYYKIPRSPKDLRKRCQLIEATTRESETVVPLIKEIGTDAIFGLMTVLPEVDEEHDTDYLSRVQDFYHHCKENDLALCVAQTDVKGDRKRKPSEQDHPDYYLRIVDRNDEGIVVRGAKAHTSASVNANEMVVLPTRTMTQDDSDYAVSFAIPIDTEGLELVASPYMTSERNEFEQPISKNHKLMETFTVFDDVFVPWERVFLAGEHEFAGPVAKAFVDFHRYTAVSYKLPLLDLLVGSAFLISDQNGIISSGHARNKLTKLISYAETVRSLIIRAGEMGSERHGICVPDTKLTNLAKYQFAEPYSEMIGYVQDLTGGLLVTSPGQEDVNDEVIGSYVDRYFGGRDTPAKDRLKVINLIRDLVVDDLGGYHQVLAIHAEGSIEAEKLALFRSYEYQDPVNYAREVAGLDE